MVFGSKQRVKKLKNIQLKIYGTRLNVLPSFKYLGIILDSSLTYNQHIAQLSKSILHKLSILSKTRKYMKTNVAILIYKSMVLPFFDYADVLLDKANGQELEKLQRLQNRGLKLCLGYNKRTNTKQIHKEAQVPLLEDRRRAHLLNFMYIRRDRRPELLNNSEIKTRAHDAPLFQVPFPRF